MIAGSQKSHRHDQVTMGNVDEPHDTENQREASREQCIEPADENALDDDVDPGHEEYLTRSERRDLIRLAACAAIHLPQRGRVKIESASPLEKLARKPLLARLMRSL